MTPPLIELRQVKKRFGQTVVLNGADLVINQGETTTIIGKSGVGKSVLLKHIIGLIEPDSGVILFEGKPLRAMRKTERRALKARFSYMFQNMALFDSMTVFENIALPLREKTSLSDAEISSKVMDKIEQLELGEIPDKYPAQISGGMKKRVAFARALITDPQIVLFDEPTTGLDPIRKSAVFSLISHYQKRYGYTAILVSHDIPDVFYISHRIALLDEGLIRFQGTPEDIQGSRDPVVQEFIHSQEKLKDEVTGLPLKKQVERKFTEEQCRCVRRDGRFSVVIFKFRHLDLVTETFGYMAAQRLLKAFATLLGERLRPFDISARFSSSEIMAIMPDTILDQAMAFCKELADHLQSIDLIGAEGREVNYSIVAGLAEAGPDTDVQSVVQIAESNQFTLVSYGPTREASTL